MNIGEGKKGGNELKIPTEVSSVFCTIAQDFYSNPLNTAEFEEWEQMKNLEKDVTINEQNKITT